MRNLHLATSRDERRERGRLATVAPVPDSGTENEHEYDDDLSNCHLVSIAGRTTLGSDPREGREEQARLAAAAPVPAASTKENDEKHDDQDCCHLVSIAPAIASAHLMLRYYPVNPARFGKWQIPGFCPGSV